MGLTTISIPSDAVAVSKLPKHFPEYKTSYIRHVLRHPEAPIFEQAGIRLISISAFKNWYDWQYNGHFSQKYLRQLQTVRDYLITNTATRAQIERDLRIRIPNICRIVAKIRETQGAYRLEVVKRDICPVTKHKAEFLRLVEIKEEEKAK